MALKTLGCTTLAALTFGALTLHGVGLPTPEVPIVKQGGHGRATNRQIRTFTRAQMELIDAQDIMDLLMLMEKLE